MKTIKPWWWYLYLPLADIKSLRDQNPQTTAFIERRYQEAVKAKRPFLLQWTWVPIDEISPYFINMEKARVFPSPPLLFYNRDSQPSTKLPLQKHARKSRSSFIAITGIFID